jgi:tetratricopeptide (TPR) repeat protein
LLGETDLRLKDLGGAISAFQRVASVSPRDSRAYFALGVLYLKMSETSRALAAYRQGLALDPNNAAANQNYAFLLMRTGRFREAVPPLTKLKAMNSADLPVRVALIESLLKCGMTGASQNELQEFFQLPSASPAGQVKLADVLAEDHLLPVAQEVFEHVIQIEPELAEAHAGLGWLFLEQGRYEEAARELGRAAQLAPASAAYSMQLAEVLLKWQNYPTALAFLRAVRNRFGNLPDYQYKLAWAHYGLHQVPEAAAVLERLIAQHEGLDLPHYSLGNCYLALSRLREAERQYRLAIQLSPKRGSYYTALGQALRLEGEDKVDEAIMSLHKALRLSPGDSHGEIQLALCYEAKRNFRQSQQILQHIVERQPDLVAAHRVLARVYYQEGFKPQGDRESAVVARLDSEQLRRRARLLDSADNPSF